MATDFYRKPSLIGKELGKRQHLQVALLYCICAILRWTAIKGSVAGFLLSKVQSITRGAIAFFEIEQIAALVDNTDGHLHIEFLGRCFRCSDHRLDCDETQVLFAWKF